jgi:hypothetical protein
MESLLSLVLYSGLAYRVHSKVKKKLKCCKYGPRGLYSLSFWMRNLWKMGIFHRKLVFFLLSITNTPAWTNILAYYGILYIRNTFIVQLQGPMLYNFLGPTFTNGPNKIECLSLADLSSLVKCLHLQLRLGAYPRGSSLKVLHFG